MSKVKSKFSLLKDRIMVLPVKISSSKGILLTNFTETGPIEGFVVSVGPGKYTKKGKFIQNPIKEKDRIIFSKSDKTVKSNGETFYVITTDDVICKLI